MSISHHTVGIQDHPEQGCKTHLKTKKVHDSNALPSTNPLSQEYEHLCPTRDECWMSSTVPPKSQQYCSNIVSLASLPNNSRLKLFHLPKSDFLLSLLLSILPGSFPLGFYKVSLLLKLLRQHSRGQFIFPKSLTTKT